MVLIFFLALELINPKYWKQHLLRVVGVVLHLHFSSAHNDLQGETALFGIGDIETPLVFVDDFETSDPACNDGEFV